MNSRVLEWGHCWLFDVDFCCWKPLNPNAFWLLLPLSVFLKYGNDPVFVCLEVFIDHFILNFNVNSFFQERTIQRHARGDVQEISLSYWDREVPNWRMGLIDYSRWLEAFSVDVHHLSEISDHAIIKIQYDRWQNERDLCQNIWGCSKMFENPLPSRLALLQNWI